MMTITTENQRTAPGEPTARAGAPLHVTPPVDAELLVTLNSRMHCRTPMKLVDPEELPVRLPVHIDGTGIITAGFGSPAGSTETYRCDCGFTIDAPAVRVHALAS